MSNIAHPPKAKSTHSSSASQKATKKKSSENIGEAAKNLETEDALAAASVENAKRTRAEADTAMKTALRAKAVADQAAAATKTGSGREPRGSQGLSAPLFGGMQGSMRKRGAVRQTETEKPSGKKARPIVDNPPRDRTPKVASDVAPLSQG